MKKKKKEFRTDGVRLSIERRSFIFFSESLTYKNCALAMWEWV